MPIPDRHMRQPQHIQTVLFRYTVAQQTKQFLHQRCYFTLRKCVLFRLHAHTHKFNGVRKIRQIENVVLIGGASEQCGDELIDVIGATENVDNVLVLGFEGFVA